MTPSDLRFKLSVRDSLFFSRGNMKFAGDTMRNFGVRSATVKTYGGVEVECWELYRKRATAKGMTSSNFFDKRTFEYVHAHAD